MFLWVLRSSGLVPVKCIEGTEEWEGVNIDSFQVPGAAGVVTCFFLFTALSKPLR